MAGEFGCAQPIARPFDNTYEVKLQHVQSSARKLTPQEEAALRRKEIEQISANRGNGDDNDGSSSNVPEPAAKPAPPANSFLFELMAKANKIKTNPNEETASTPAEAPAESQTASNAASGAASGITAEETMSPVPRKTVKTSKNVKAALEKQFSLKFAQIKSSSPAPSPARKSYLQSTFEPKSAAGSPATATSDNSSIPPASVKGQSLVRFKL